MIYLLIHFYPHDTVLVWIIAMSLYLCVCVSVTCRYCVKTAELIWLVFSTETYLSPISDLSSRSLHVCLNEYVMLCYVDDMSDCYHCRCPCPSTSTCVATAVDSSCLTGLDDDDDDNVLLVHVFSLLYVLSLLVYYSGE